MPLFRLNRPISRYAARLYIRLRYGAKRAHLEECWPDLCLIKAGNGGANGMVRYDGRVIAPLLPWPEHSPQEEELIVIGSGPSLARQATEKIPIERAILVNGAIHLLCPPARPFALVVEDERFIWRHWQALEQLVPENTDCYFSTSAIRALCQTAPAWLSTQRIRHMDFVHKPYGRSRPDQTELKGLPFLRWSADGQAAISLCPGMGLMPAGSVAATAAQIALALRPARIGIAGVDLTAMHSPRFYEGVASVNVV